MKSADIATSGLLSEKAADSLFTLDTTGSTEIQKAYNKSHRPLKSEEILAQRSVVPAVTAYKRPAGVTDGVLEPKRKRQAVSHVSGKDYRRLQELAQGTKSLDQVIQISEEPDHDPWGPSLGSEPQDPRLSFIEKVKPVRAPLTIKEVPISLLEGIKSVPSVPLPRAGTSYNPTAEEWDAVMMTAGQEEVDAERRRLRAAQLEKDQQDRIDAARLEAEREEAWHTEDESAWEGFETEADTAEWLKKRRPERMTPQQRKKAERKKERERAEKMQRRAKEKEKQEKQIADLTRQAKSKAKDDKQLAAVETQGNLEDVRDIDDRVLRRRRFGKDPIPEAPLEVVLPDELQDSLRLLKPEGNLLRDRFRNILISGKLETRKPIQQAKKKRRTLTEKWTHKDFQVGLV